MNKRIVLLIIILIIAGLATGYVDNSRFKASEEPKFVLRQVDEFGKKVTYWGIGYKVIVYPSVSPNEPFKDNKGAKFGSWFMQYEIGDL